MSKKSEYGRMGGEKTREKYGREFFSNVGRKGGMKIKEKTEGDPEYYKRIGAMGGQKISELVRRGKELEKKEEDEAESNG